MTPRQVAGCRARCSADKPITGNAEESSTGEYDAAAASDAAVQVVGDVLDEWEKKMDEQFGGPEKTIVFANTVADGQHYAAAFRDRVVTTSIAIAYLDGAQERKEELIQRAQGRGDPGAGEQSKR